MRKTAAAALFTVMCAPFAAPAEGEPTTPGAERPFDLVILGDSLTAGFGLAEPDLLAESLEAHLGEAGLDHVRVRGAGVSGDTAAGGRRRFDWAVGEGAEGVLIELGANDMFEGRDPGAIAADLRAMVETAQARGLWVGLIGMRAPRNAGEDYRAAFDGLYPRLAEETCAALYPFYFDGLIDAETGAARDALFLPDGIHPNAQGVAIVAQRMGAWLAEALKEAADCTAD